MIAAVIGVLTFLGPDPAAVVAGPPVRLPDGGDRWDWVGAFRLTDSKGKAAIVRLYTQTGVWTVPNSFALHAMTWSEGREWKHQTVLEGYRIVFCRVRDRDADAVILEMRNNTLVRIDPHRELGPQLKRADEINKQFLLRLVLVDGSPVLKRIDSEPRSKTAGTQKK